MLTYFGGEFMSLMSWPHNSWILQSSYVCVCLRGRTVAWFCCIIFDSVFVPCRRSGSAYTLSNAHSGRQCAKVIVYKLAIFCAFQFMQLTTQQKRGSVARRYKRVPPNRRNKLLGSLQMIVALNLRLLLWQQHRSNDGTRPALAHT